MNFKTMYHSLSKEDGKLEVGVPVQLIGIDHCKVQQIQLHFLNLEWVRMMIFLALFYFIMLYQ